jgi:hypothetical protein
VKVSQVVAYELGRVFGDMAVALDVELIRHADLDSSVLPNQSFTGGRYVVVFFVCICMRVCLVCLCMVYAYIFLLIVVTCLPDLCVWFSLLKHWLGRSC